MAFHIIRIRQGSNAKLFLLGTVLLHVRPYLSEAFQTPTGTAPWPVSVIGKIKAAFKPKPKEKKEEKKK